MKDNDLHPGITIHNMPVGGGIPGLIFTIGSIAIFLIGFPLFWYILALAIVLGVVIAVILHHVHNSKFQNTRYRSLL